MKKLASLIMLLSLLVFLVACGRQLPENPTSVPDTSNSEEVEATEVESTGAEADDNSDTANADEDAVDEEAEDTDAGDESESDESDTNDEPSDTDENDTEDVEPGDEDETTESTLIGDPENGAILFTNIPANAPCSSCHFVDSDQMLVGPGLQGVAEIAGDRVPGEDAITYLRESIVDPNAYTVEGFPAQVMPPNYGANLSEEQINDLIAYLLSL
jgi:mono/diheme cytochrome c family protein